MNPRGAGMIEAVIGRMRAGLSPRAIRDELGLTRGQVNGIVWRARRAGLLPPAGRRPAKRAARPPRAAGCGRRRLAAEPAERVAAPPRPPRGPRPPRSPEPAPRMTGLVDLARNDCRWPFGDGISAGFCGHPAAPGRPYCRHHLERSTA